MHGCILCSPSSLALRWAEKPIIQLENHLIVLLLLFFPCNFLLFLLKGYNATVSKKDLIYTANLTQPAK